MVVLDIFGIFTGNKSGSGGRAQSLRLIKKQRTWDALVKDDLQNKAICLGFPGGEGRNTSEVCKKVSFSENRFK